MFHLVRITIPKGECLNWALNISGQYYTARRRMKSCLFNHSFEVHEINDFNKTVVPTRNNRFWYCNIYILKTALSHGKQCFPYLELVLIRNEIIRRFGPNCKGFLVEGALWMHCNWIPRRRQRRNNHSEQWEPGSSTSERSLIVSPLAWEVELPCIHSMLREEAPYSCGRNVEFFITYHDTVFELTLVTQKYFFNFTTNSCCVVAKFWLTF